MEYCYKNRHLVLWSLLLSPCASNPEQVEHLQQLWVDIWQRRSEQRREWTAKVPLSVPLGLTGTYALIQGYGCVEGDYEILGLAPEPELLLCFDKVLQTPTYKVKGELTATTKRRLESWLKKAYPQRFRHPGPVKGLPISRGEILLIGSPVLREAIKELVVEATVQETVAADPRYSSTTDGLKVLRHDAQTRFEETLKVYRGRKKRSLGQAATGMPVVLVTSELDPHYIVVKGRRMAYLPVLGRT